MRVAVAGNVGTSRSPCGSAISEPPIAVGPSSGSGAAAGAGPRVGCTDGDPAVPAASVGGPYRVRSASLAKFDSQTDTTLPGGGLKRNRSTSDDAVVYETYRRSDCSTCAVLGSPEASGGSVTVMVAGVAAPLMPATSALAPAAAAPNTNPGKAWNEMV